MIQVLIVDDDKIARIGIKNAMPWKKYSMEICGEAANGIQALNFIEKNQVDLAFVDLEMPGMFGLELLKKFKQVWPKLNTVVLTMHHDYQYIQEALRLNVLDYIIKTELSEDSFDEILGRIKKRFDENNSMDLSNVENNEEYSYEIRKCIEKAVHIINNERVVHLTATSVAKEVNMSRGYFMDCL